MSPLSDRRPRIISNETLTIGNIDVSIGQMTQENVEAIASALGIPESFFVFASDLVITSTQKNASPFAQALMKGRVRLIPEQIDPMPEDEEDPNSSRWIKARHIKDGNELVYVSRFPISVQDADALPSNEYMSLFNCWRVKTSFSVEPDQIVITSDQFVDYKMNIRAGSPEYVTSEESQQLETTWWQGAVWCFTINNNTLEVEDNE